MANHISENSLKNSLNALDELKKISQKYSDAPKINCLEEEQISWLNERIMRFHESVKNTNYKKFSFFNKSKEIRNSIAHSTAELSSKEIEANWQGFYSFIDIAKMELQKNVERSYSEQEDIREFEKSGSNIFGDEIERKRLTQALNDKMNPFLEETDKLDFSDNQTSKEVQKFLNVQNQTEESLLEFARKDGTLNLQIQSEILKLLQTVYEDTDIHNTNNPFYEENEVINKVQHASSTGLLKQLDKHKAAVLNTASGKNNSTNFDYYKKQYDKEADKVKPDLHEIEILARNLKSDLKKSLIERFIAWQLEEIDNIRKQYLDDLYKYLFWVQKNVQKINDCKNFISVFVNPQMLVENFVKASRGIWQNKNKENNIEHRSGFTLDEGFFDDTGFRLLEEFAQLLENDKGLQELADLIGRQEIEQERYEIELREKTELKTEYHPKPAYKGQISGVRLSGEISAALPSELAMFKNQSTKLYFSQKFAEKKLLSYKYVNKSKSYRSITGTEEVHVSVNDSEEKGPVLICVDTSGSMCGTPERVAKTITFALAKKCLAEGRGCYLISFSVGIQEKNLADYSSMEALAALVDFLKDGFGGGTDASLALIRSIGLMNTREWKNADVLVVTDGDMGAFSNKLVSEIEAQKEKKSKFYILEIGNSANPEVVKVFDEYWYYDSNARDSMKHLVRNIAKI